jgi:hypothetical protein
MVIDAVEFPVFQPAMRIISAITNADRASITTTFAHQYVDGLVVRLNIPLGFGMAEVNQLFGKIIITSPTTFTIDINTKYFTQFSIPTTFPLDRQEATVTPMGEINQTINAATRNVLPYP